MKRFAPLLLVRCGACGRKLKQLLGVVTYSVKKGAELPVYVDVEGRCGHQDCPGAYDWKGRPRGITVRLCLQALRVGKRVFLAVEEL